MILKEDRVLLIRDFVFGNPLNTFLLSFILFLLLYFSFTAVALLFTRNIDKQFKLSKQPDYNKAQIIKEIKLSILSILIFALQSIFIQIGYKYSWIHINWHINVYTLVLQIFILFLWNEIHFYLSHRLFHTKWFFKNVHKIHHFSHNPSPFSVYSFHWIEAFVLGTVIFFPLLIYPFQYAAILSLPVISIFLNVLGHWDYDLFPTLKPSNLMRFSYRHSMHHRKVHGNYGFLLPIFDIIFKTELKHDAE